ncbi:hypothetical protein J0J29_24080, partial [Vibrio vulnificus]|uniref:hypothetical protein n=1 Tax=Vibrio vulnificus TaxID=672 RepID=UPI0019D4B374
MKLPETIEGIPNRVKIPDFTLYEGSSNLETHLDDYVTCMKVAECDGRKIKEFFSLSLAQGP